MPIHVYLCTSCELAQEYLSLSSDDTLRACDRCGGTNLTRQMAAGSFHLKGGGWAGDGYSSKAHEPDRGAKEARIRRDIHEQHRDREKENDQKAEAHGLRRTGDYQEIKMYPEQPIE